MPLFAVHALDHPNALASRLQHYTAHRAFIETDELFGVSVVLSGPLQTPDGETMIGSLFLIEGDSMEAFLNADPYAVHKIWGAVSIQRFHRRKG